MSYIKKNKVKVPTVHLYFAEDKSTTRLKVNLRVTYNKQHIYMRLPYTADVRDVDFQYKHNEITNKWLRYKVEQYRKEVENIILNSPPDLEIIKRKCQEKLDLQGRERKKQLSLENGEVVFKMDFFAIADEYTASRHSKFTRHTVKSQSINKLRRYCNEKGIEKLNINDLKASFVQEFVGWLEQTHPDKTSVVRCCLIYLQAIINFAKQQYNNEEEGIVLVTVNPFGKVKIPQQRQSDFAERKTVSLSFLRYLINMKRTGDRLMDFSRDVLLLSFALCGANIEDMLDAEFDSEDRVCFDRQKTRGRVTDRSSYISIRIEPEFQALFDKYASKDGIKVFDFSKYMEGKSRLLFRVNYGLRKLQKVVVKKYAEDNGVSVEVAKRKVGVGDMSYYTARHTWSSIAVNDCDIDIVTVDRCLCHSVKSLVARSYIKRDFKFVDIANRKVMDYVFGE